MTRIVVGSRLFKFPTSQIKFLERWSELQVGEEHVRQVNRDSGIFAYIHRWLCGYPAHLPPTEWETICLLADCENVYGTLKLRQELLEQLREQDSNLGRKARILLSDDLQLTNRAFITDTWAKISEPALSELTPAVQQLCTEVANILENSGHHQLKLISPFLKIIVQQNLCQGILQYLMRQHAVIPQVEFLNLIKLVIAWKMPPVQPPIGRNPPKSPIKEHDASSDTMSSLVKEDTSSDNTPPSMKEHDFSSDDGIPPLESSDDEPPAVSSDVENPTSGKRTIPPPKWRKLPPLQPVSMIDLGIEKILSRFGGDEAGVRVFAPE